MEVARTCQYDEQVCLALLVVEQIPFPRRQGIPETKRYKGRVIS